MENPFLLVMAATNLVAAAFFALTARSIAARPLSPHARPAGIAFAASWAMLAMMAASDAARLVLAWAPDPDVVLYATVARFKILFTAVMIAGFGYYVAYLWTGKRSMSLPIILFALSHALIFLYLMDRRVPVEVMRGTWGSGLIFEHSSVVFAESSLLLYFYFFAPPIVLALAFMSLLLLFNEHKHRLRIIGTVLVIFSYQGIGFLLYSPRADLDHIINPLVMLLVVAIACFAWWVHRGPATAQAQETGPVSAQHSQKET